MKAITLGLCVACLTQQANAQSNIAAGGGDATGSGGSVSYSVGQIDYSNVSGTNHNWNEGVQQPYEFYKPLDLEELDIGASVYPNPTNGEINIKVEQLSTGLIIQLFDAAGKEVLSRELSSSETLIELAPFAAGVYTLSLSSASKNQTIKIIKH